MADRARVQEVNEAAERAAEGGNFARAAELLGQAAALLEGDADARGELANTLNNLGVACERLGRLDDAEAAYRRACAIAAEAYPADHPFVVRSTENLHDFLAARSVEAAAETPPPADTQPTTAAPPAASVGGGETSVPAVPPAAATAGAVNVGADIVSAVTPEKGTGQGGHPPSPPRGFGEPSEGRPDGSAGKAGADRVSAVAPEKGTGQRGREARLDGGAANVARADERRADPRSTRVEAGDLPLSPPSPKRVPDAPGEPAVPALTVQNRKASRLPLIFGVILLVLIVGSFVGARACAAGFGREALSVTMDGATAPSSESAGQAGALDDGDALASDDAPEGDGAVDPEVADSASVAAGAAGDASVGAETLALVEARVCRDFAPTGAEWQCTEVVDETAPGVLVYYTRLRTPAAAQVEHHWYFDDALLQRVTLDIGANTSAGYRTYSRDTIPPDGAGSWRVELRSSTGAVLHEARFEVR